MIVCVIGGGAREHALATALSRTARVYVTPGNAGIVGSSPEGHELLSLNRPPEEIEADLYVIGPEGPLVAGLADRLRAMGRLVFGPSAAGARLEGSKAYMKELARRAGVPTARFAVFENEADAIVHLRASNPPYVVKTDGLAAGKGVLVTKDLAEAEADVRAKLSGAAFGEAGRRIVIEEGLVGEELSFHVLLDGTRALILPAAQDFKRVFDGDLGPNTGGMGAYSPVAAADEKTMAAVMEQIIEPTIAALRDDGVEYRGVLYAGCMLSSDGPQLIEYNVRFGDPETQVILPLVEGDVAELLASAAAGALPAKLEVKDAASVCVVMAAAGYPDSPAHGNPIHGIDRAGTVDEVSVLHAGTTRGPDGEVLTAGGRVLCVQALGATLSEARASVYRAVGEIEFEGMQFRRDIAAKAASSEVKR